VKRTSLTLSLLILLSGFSQEPTQLENCIEANKLSNEYYDKWGIFLFRMPKNEEEREAYTEENLEDFYKNLNRIEISTRNCSYKELKLKQSDLLNTEEKMKVWEEVRKFCESQINDEEIERVRKICLSKDNKRLT